MSVRSKRLGLLVFAATFWLGTCVHYVVNSPFRFPGSRGEMYDTWETSNSGFKIRMKAYYEVGTFLPGAFYTCESAPVGSNEWREFKAFRGDDPIPLSYLNKRFRFVNERTAYFHTANDFLVTLDNGRNWSVWLPMLPGSDGKSAYWAILDAHVGSDGSGKAKLWHYDEALKDAVTQEIFTQDYGQNWKVVPNTFRTADPRDF